MHLTVIDWAIVVAYFALSAGIGVAFTKKGGESLEEYFISGRNVSWWLAGASMVATTFAADTPLVVTGIVASNGVAGNWLWWNMLMSGMLTVFFYARLWRRAGVMTDIEFGLVANGRLVAEVRDVGTFSPGAEIKHQFGLNPNVFPLQTALSRCVPLRIIFADGTTWKNGHLPKRHHRTKPHG